MVKLMLVSPKEENFSSEVLNGIINQKYDGDTSNILNAFKIGCAALADIILSIPHVAKSILFFGTNRDVNLRAFGMTSKTKIILANPFLFFIRVLNGKALSRQNISDQMFKLKDEGILAGTFQYALQDFHQFCINSDYFIFNHVYSRVTTLFSFSTCLVLRVFDGVLGAGFAGLAVLTFGRVNKFNSLAYRGLQAPALLNDAYVHGLKFMNPWAELPKIEATQEAINKF